MMNVMIFDHEATELIDAYSNAGIDRNTAEKSSLELCLVVRRIYIQGQSRRPPTTMQEIGEKLGGLSRQRISQYIDKAENYLERQDEKNKKDAEE